MSVISVNFVEFKLEAEWRVTLLACGIFLYQTDHSLEEELSVITKLDFH